MMKAVGLALTAEPQDVGTLRIAAGEDPKEISRWVMQQRINRPKKK